MKDYLYQNKGNSRKYIEVRKYADGHYVWKQYIIHFEHTRFESKNYTGCSLRRAKKGTWHRVGIRWAADVLTDYTLVKEVVR